MSNTAIERFYSRIKRVKSSKMGSLSQARLCELLRIGYEGPSFLEYGASETVKLWANKTIRRPNQRKRKQYKREQYKRKQYKREEESGKKLKVRHGFIER